MEARCHARLPDCVPAHCQPLREAVRVPLGPRVFNGQGSVQFGSLVKEVLERGGVIEGRVVP
jgi:hypothetical protein